MCFRSMRFLKINILQGSVVTLFRCGDVCNNPFIADFLLSVTVKEFLKKFSYFVEISTGVYSLLFLSHPVYLVRPVSTELTIQAALARFMYCTGWPKLKYSRGKICGYFGNGIKFYNQFCINFQLSNEQSTGPCSYISAKDKFAMLKRINCHFQILVCFYYNQLFHERGLFRASQSYWCHSDIIDRWFV